MKLTIIETGQVPAAIRGDFSDYPEMFRRMVAQADGTIACETVSVAKGEALPDPAALDQAIALATAVAQRLGAPPPRAEAILALPGVLRAETAEPDEAAEEAKRAALATAFDVALQGLVASRAREGAQLATILGALLDEIAALREAAAAEAALQPEAQRQRLIE